ncbi:MAG TPA: pyroglutamyl-peptidase I, partial [Rudaea sp.]
MSRTPRALVTGFDPFGGEAVNPAQLIAQALDGEVIAAHRIVGAILPTQFGAAPAVLEKLIARHRPALVLALGQAGGRDGISLERVAVNLIDARI